MRQFLFTLYVAGESPRSHQAAANLRRLVEDWLGGGEYEVTVVDVTREPQRAEEQRILTTPTLVKESPGPVRRVTGDLSDPGRVLAALALDPVRRGERGTA